MQDTKQIRKYVLEVAERTYKIMDLETTPKIVFTIKDWNKYHKSYKMRKSNLYGRASLNQGAPVVFINIDPHKSVKALNDTIVHEIYHIKDMKKSHGKAFDRTVNFYLERLFDYGFDGEGKIKKYAGSKY